MSMMSPWNYGNYYMGNTTMQMMPMMMRKVSKFQQRMMGGGLGGMPMLPMLPMVPCIPSYYAMAASAPMMAAATPLPMALNPVVQSAYPIGNCCGPTFMSPSAFASTLSSGPLPFQPPSSFQFPSNVNMVMNIPFGFSNSLLSMPSFGGFAPQLNSSGALSCCCFYCTTPSCPPQVSFYPRPVSVPQPYPVPVPNPIPITNIQPIPIPRQVNVIAPPIVAGGGLSGAIPAGNSLVPSQGVLNQIPYNTVTVNASNGLRTEESLLSDRSSIKKKSLSADETRRLKAEKIAASLSNLGLDDYRLKKSSNRAPKHRKHRSSKFTDEIKFDSPKRRVHRSNSNLSEISWTSTSSRGSKFSQRRRSTLSLNENVLNRSLCHSRKAYTIIEE